jgi:predicted phosphate transport protein (TIGR00153 family)
LIQPDSGYIYPNFQRMSISTFFARLVPREKKFYPMFEQMAGFILQAATVQLEILEQKNPVKEKDLLKSIHDLENEGDRITQEIFEELDRTFVTPFDREDIHLLTSRLDSVLDLMQSVAQRIRMYRPKDFPDECKDLARMILKGAEQIQIAVVELKTLKKSGKILKAVKKMTDIETEADDLYHSTISSIFKKQKDAIELIKQKEIVEHLERTTDRIEDVSDVLKTIILKNA